MKKKRFLEFGLLGIMFAAVIVGFATRQTIKKATPSVYNFYYYPKANVYYNKTENNYIFSNGSGTWQIAKNLPSTTSYILDKKVDLTAPSFEIWKDNDRHRLVYSVSLYASAADLKEPEVKTIPPPPQVDKKEKEETKKENGIKGFFKKIFKKKKEAS